MDLKKKLQVIESQRVVHIFGIPCINGKYLLYESIYIFVFIAMLV